MNKMVFPKFQPSHRVKAEDKKSEIRLELFLKIVQNHSWQFRVTWPKVPLAYLHTRDPIQ